MTPIRTVDKITVGSGRRGPITEAVQRRFFDIISGAVPDDHGWLTYVDPEHQRRAQHGDKRGEPAHAR